MEKAALRLELIENPSSKIFEEVASKKKITATGIYGKPTRIVALWLKFLT
jgi:hypothetical protein